MSVVSPHHVMMKVPVLYAALLLSSLGLAGALFVPEELPTLLSFLYTNIPPVFKGTDSRLGIGFRVGPNADFQVQLELGPQTRTQKLGPEEEGSNKKRQVLENQLNNFPTVSKKRKKKKKTPVPETPMGWLQTWKDSLANNPQQEEVEEIKPYSQPVIDYDTVMHLYQLYKKEPSAESDAVNDSSVTGGEVDVINDEELKWDLNMINDTKVENNLGANNDESVNIDTNLMKNMMVTSGINIMNDPSVKVNPNVMGETILPSEFQAMNEQSVKRGPSIMSGMAVMKDQSLKRYPPSMMSRTGLPSGMTLINYYQGVKRGQNMMSDTMLGSDMTTVNDPTYRSDPSVTSSTRLPNGMALINQYQGITRGSNMLSNTRLRSEKIMLNDQSVERYPYITSDMNVMGDHSVKSGLGVVSRIGLGSTVNGLNYQGITRGPSAINNRRITNDRIWRARPPRVWKVIRF